MGIPYHPAVPLLGIYPNEIKSAYERVAAAEFTIVKIRNPPRMNETCLTTKQMQLETIMLIEISHSKKSNFIIFSDMWQLIQNPIACIEMRIL